MKILRSRKVLLVVGVAGLGLVARLGFAGHGTSVPSYTGCLNLNSGTFVSVAPGNAPLSPCGPAQAQVHLSGGDISSVVAGTGLTGGATEGVATLQVDQSTIPTGITAGFGLVGGGTGGDITLAVDPTVIQKRIVNTCQLGFGGRAIVSVSESGVVECSEGPLVFHGEKAGSEEVAQQFSQIGTLFLNGGHYLVIAKVLVEAINPELPGNDYIHTDCELVAGDTRDEAILQGDVDIVAGGTMTMMLAVELSSDGDAAVRCQDRAQSGNFVAQMQWRNLRISAVRLDKSLKLPI